MTRGRADTHDASDGRFLTLLDDDGDPPHGDECATCGLFLAHQRPFETRAAWMERLASGWRALWPDLGEPMTLDLSPEPPRSGRAGGAR